MEKRKHAYNKSVMVSRGFYFIFGKCVWRKKECLFVSSRGKEEEREKRWYKKKKKKKDGATRRPDNELRHPLHLTRPSVPPPGTNEEDAGRQVCLGSRMEGRNRAGDNYPRE